MIGGRRLGLSRRRRSIAFLALLFSAALAERAEAVGTRSFLLDDAKTLAEGKLDGTAVHSTGHVTLGLEAQRIELPQVSLAYSLLVAKDGTAYVGTGNDGKVMRVRGNAVSEFAATGQLLVASLAFGEGATIYAGTLPAGKIFAIDAAGKNQELVALPGAEHVWDLVYDAKRKRLFAATGPEGKVFSIDAKGRTELYYDSSAAHIMSLALDDDGVLYAGTSDDALVVRIAAPSRAEVLYDFPGNEITDLDVRGGTLAVAANEFPKPPAAARATKANANGNSSSSAIAARPKPGKGVLWRLGADGRAELLFQDDEAHIACVQLSADGVVYAGSGKGGRIHRIEADRSSATVIDVEERQVLALDLDAREPIFVTGDTGVVYRVNRGRPEKAEWTSAVLDAKFQARWGRLAWRGVGAIEMQTRSGNTAEPDATWSEWSSALKSPGPVRSPAARFVQVRGRFKSDPNAKLWAAELYYLPTNQRAVVDSVSLAPAGRSTKPEGETKASSVYRLAWKVSNEDEDPLRYRLRFRGEGQTRWREILKQDEELKETSYSWETSGLPDGWYVVQVEASDELANPEARVLRATGESEPILIDNHPPTLGPLRHVGRSVSGVAKDSPGPIAKLELAIDGGSWRIVFPTDGLLDAAEESFEIDLGDLDEGEHIVAVRATDAGGNTTSAETTVRVTKKNR